MKFTALVWIVVLLGLPSIVVAQEGTAGSEAKSGERVFQVQKGSARAPGSLAQSERALALQEAARLTIEANLAFDRGDSETGRARARAALAKLKSVEEQLVQPGSGRARSRLAEQRGRLQLEFLGDEAAARKAFEDSVLADDNPAAERLLIELVEREERRAGPRAPTPGS